jgi:hypothetical protein
MLELYGLDGRRFRFLSRQGRDFPLLHVVQVGYGFQPVPYLIDIVGLFP